jgi:hypothetical protein
MKEAVGDQNAHQTFLGGERLREGTEYHGAASQEICLDNRLEAKMRPYAERLIKRHSHMKKVEGEQDAHQTFLGEEDSVKGMHTLTPEAKKMVLEDYEEVRKAVFPNQPPDTAPEQ